MEIFGKPRKISEGPERYRVSGAIAPFVQPSAPFVAPILQPAKRTACAGGRLCVISRQRSPWSSLT
jgi:hypothetical protein